MPLQQNPFLPRLQNQAIRQYRPRQKKRHPRLRQLDRHPHIAHIRKIKPLAARIEPAIRKIPAPQQNPPPARPERKRPVHLLQITVSSLGAFTASIALDGTAYAFTGGLSVTGAFTGAVGPGTASVPVTLDLSLDGSGVLSGAINGENFTAYHPAYVKGQTVMQAGKYTVSLQATTAGPSVPQGTGHGTMTVSATGAVRLAGKLADGTPFTVAEPLVVNGNSKSQLLFCDKSLYSKKGSLSGSITFETLTNSACDGALQWIKPPGNTGPYQAGFATGVSALGALDPAQ